MATSTFNFSMELSEYDLKTRELFNTVEWSPMNAVIAQVFVSHSSLSLMTDDIARMCSSAVVREGVQDLQDALTNLVRKKVLRSRKITGRTFYEVNY